MSVEAEDAATATDLDSASPQETVLDLLNAILQISEDVEESGKNDNADAANKEGGFVVCDLCNTVVVGSVSDHVADEHADIGRAAEGATLEEHRDGWAAAAAHASHDSDADKLLNAKIGAYAFLAVAPADRGADMFNVISKATEQMKVLLASPQDKSQVFLFGSCVTMGLWDGIGDADFTAYLPTKVDPKTGEPSHSAQKSAILELTKKLRYGGFHFDELEPVIGARVPVVRRKRDTKRPHELRHVDEPYIIEFHFKDAAKRSLFLREAAPALKRKYGAQELNEGGKNKKALMYGFSDGANALKLFSRRENIAEPTKRWKLHCRLPEIFSVDFDLSCRTFGIRNSWFLRKYMEQNPVFRAGSLFVKQWSKECGINNSRSGFLTSYAVSNLWVYYLLRIGQAKFVDPLSLPTIPTEEAYGTVPYMPLWPFPEDDKESLARLGATLRGFFRFYAEVFDWSSEVVSLRQDCSSGDAATVLTKQALGWTSADETDSIILRNRVFYRVCIEDVYENNLNLARHLSPPKAEWFHAQFRTAWAWCSTADPVDTVVVVGNGDNGTVREVGTWSSLLSDGYIRRAELSLRTALWRQLLLSGGSASVRELKDAMRSSHPDLLPTYELFHRFSDLWFDYDMVAEDAANNTRHRRRGAELPASPELVSEDTWVAVSGASLFPIPASQDPSDRDNRVVFLANGNILPAGADQANATTTAADRHREVAPLFESAASLVRDILAKINAEVSVDKDGAEEGGMAMPADIRAASELVTKAFFTVDGLAFGTYRARDTFVRHLGAVAESLANPATARSIADALRGKRRKAGAEAAAPIISTFYGRTSGDSVNPATVSFIFAQRQYVSQNPTTGDPEATALLLTHQSKDSVEEDKKRVSRAPRAAPPKEVNKPILRDCSTGKVARCSQCGKANVTTYGTNQPSIDGGRYCMVCWSAY